MAGGGKRWTREVPGGMPCVMPFNPARGNRRYQYTGTAANVSQDIEPGRAVPLPMGALALNGSSSKVEEGGATAYQFDFGTGDYTIDLWVKVTGVGNKYLLRLVGCISLYLTGTFAVTASGAIAYFSTTDGAVVQDRWTHIALTRSGDVHRLFVNGVQLGTQTVSGSSGSATGIALGNYSTVYLQGFIGWVRVVKGKALWTANFLTPRRTARPQKPAGCAVLYDWTLDAAADSVSLMEPASSMTMYGTPGIGGRTWDFTAAQTYYATYAPPPCAYFGFTNGTLTLSDYSQEFNLGSGAFTIDGWAYGGYIDRIVGKWDTGGGKFCWKLGFDNSNIYFRFTTDGYTQTTITRALPVTSFAKWHHYAAVRTGNVIRLFQDGVQCGADYAFSGTIWDSANAYVRIGSDDTSCQSYLRITIGTALWTGTSFTVPTEAEYTVGANTKALLPFTQNYGILGVVTYPHDRANVSRVWTNTGGVKTACSNPFSMVSITSEDFTIDCWVNLRGSLGADIAGHYDDSGTLGRSWAISVQDAAYRINFLYGSTTVSSTVTLQAYAWHHVAIMRSGTTLYLAIDGQLETFSIGSTALDISRMPLSLGARMGSAGTQSRLFSGRVSGLRITRGQALWTAAFNPPDRPTRKNANVAFVDDEECLSAFEMGPNLGSYIYTASNTPFNLGYGNHTMDAWVFTERSATASLVVCSRAYDWWFGVKTNGALTAGPANMGYSYQVTSVAGAVPDRTWTHVAFVRSGTGAGQGKLYINGVEPAYATQDAPNWNLGTTGQFSVAGYSVGGLYAGRVKNVRVASRALWSANFTPPRLRADYATLDGIICQLFGNYYTTGSNTYVVDSGPNNLTFYSTVNILEKGFTQDGFAAQIGGNTYTPRTQERPFCVDWGSGSTTQHYRMHRSFGGMAYALPFTPSKSIGYCEAGFDYDGNVKNVRGGYSATQWYFADAPFTIQMWFRYSGTTYPKHLLNQGTDDNNFAFRLSIISATQLKWSSKYTGTEEYAITATRGGVTLNDGAWHHVAVVRSGTTTTVYIDGTSGGSQTLSQSYRAFLAMLFVGDKADDTAEKLISGRIGVVEVVKGVALWAGTFTPSTDRRGFIHAESVLSLFAEYTNSFSYIQPVDVSSVATSMSMTTYSGYATWGGTTPVHSTRFGTSDFTIDLWGRSPSGTSTLDMFNYSNTWAPSAVDTNAAIRIYQDTSNYVCFSVYNGTTRYTVTGNALRGTNTWKHIALVRVGTTITLYVDGVSAGAQTVAANYAIQDAVAMSWRQYSPNSSNPGFIDQMRVFVGRALWTGAFTPPRTATEYRRQYGAECYHWVHGARKSEPYDMYTFPAGFEGAMAQSGYYEQTGVTMSPQTAVRTPFAPGSGDFTVEFWVYFASRPSTGYSRGIAAGGSPTMGGAFYAFQFMQNSSGQVVATLYDETKAGVATMGSGIVPNSRWVHIALSRKGSSLMMFTDGYLSNSTTDTTRVGCPTVTPTFWNEGSGNPWSLAGCISNFQFHTGVAKYTHGFVPTVYELKLPRRIARY